MARIFSSASSWVVVFRRSTILVSPMRVSAVQASANASSQSVSLMTSCVTVPNGSLSIVFAPPRVLDLQEKRPEVATGCSDSSFSESFEEGLEELGCLVRNALAVRGLRLGLEALSPSLDVRAKLSDAVTSRHEPTPR